MRDTAGRRERGQLVLLAAVALAVALVPLTLAYLQLGYQATVDTGADPIADTERVLDRALENATDGVARRYAWTDRDAAVDAVRAALAPTVAALNTSRLDAGTAVALSFNDSRARTRADARCPGGPNRQFGPCRADRGVVVQDRAGRTHVLAVAVDVVVTAPDRTYRGTLVVDHTRRNK